MWLTFFDHASMNTSAPPPSPTAMLLTDHPSRCAFKPMWDSTKSMGIHDKIVNIGFLCNVLNVMWSDTSHLFYHEAHVTQNSFLWPFGPTQVRSSSLCRFLDHTQQRTTVGRIPLDELSARSRDLYLTIHNTHDTCQCRQRVSNPQSLQASGRRPTIENAGPLGPTKNTI